LFTEIFIQTLIELNLLLTGYIKCAICGNDIEYDEFHPFKICLNCRILGPDKPARYMIPKGSDLPPSVHDRLFPIVSDEELPEIYNRYFEDLRKFVEKKIYKNRRK
jgi:hypothetical protein